MRWKREPSGPHGPDGPHVFASTRTEAWVQGRPKKLSDLFMKSFTNKIAAITGAGSGMGRSLAIALAKRSCHLALSDIDETTLEETATLARAHHVNVTTKRVDVAKRNEVYTWADDVV